MNNRKFEGYYNRAEIAKELGVNPGSVNYRIERGRVPPPTHYLPGYLKPLYTVSEAKDIIEKFNVVPQN